MSSQGPSTIQSAEGIMEAFVKIAIIGVIIFLIVEAINYKNSPIGKAVGQLFGAVAGFASWLAAHPNTVIAGIFLYILMPLLVPLLGLTFKGVKALMEKLQNSRTNEEKIQETNPDYNTDNPAAEDAALAWVTNDAYQQKEIDGSGSQEEIDASLKEYNDILTQVQASVDDLNEEGKQDYEDYTAQYGK